MTAPLVGCGTRTQSKKLVNTVRYTTAPSLSKITSTKKNETHRTPPLMPSQPRSALPHAAHMYPYTNPELPIYGPALNPPYSHRPLPPQLLRIPLLLLLLTVLQPHTSMTLQHAMFATKMPRTEPAVPDDALRGVFAVFGAAADFLGRAAEEREREVQCAVADDGVRGEGLRGGQVFAGVD